MPCPRFAECAGPPNVHRLQLQPFSSAQHVCDLPVPRPLAAAAHLLQETHAKPLERFRNPLRGEEDEDRAAAGATSEGPATACRGSSCGCSTMSCAQGARSRRREHEGATECGSPGPAGGFGVSKPSVSSNATQWCTNVYGAGALQPISLPLFLSL